MSPLALNRTEMEVSICSAGLQPTRRAVARPRPGRLRTSTLGASHPTAAVTPHPGAGLFPPALRRHIPRHGREAAGQGLRADSRMCWPVRGKRRKTRWSSFLGLVSPLLLAGPLAFPSQCSRRGRAYAMHRANVLSWHRSALGNRHSICCRSNMKTSWCERVSQHRDKERGFQPC